MEMDEWNKILDIDLNGCVIGMKYIIREMKKAGIWCIVGMAGTSPYTTAKSALRLLSKSADIRIQSFSLTSNQHCYIHKLMRIRDTVKL